VKEDILKKTNLLSVFAVLGTTTSIAAVAVSGCSTSSGNTTPGDASTSDSTTGEDSPTGDTSTPEDSSPGTDGGTEAEAATPNPAPPVLGTLLDRMGRPAINTALNNTFDLSEGPDGGAVTCLAETNFCAAKDQYNTDNTPSDWNANWGMPFFLSLAILDSLDNVCGNQAGYNATLGGTTYPAYTALSGLFAQDALWVNTGSTTCSVYLGVELNTLGVTNTDCGGRTLTENTLDVTYNLLAGTETISGGAPVLPVAGPATNGITAPATAPSATFPYFATPH
jgi:hypothetical protein